VRNVGRAPPSQANVAGLGAAASTDMTALAANLLNSIKGFTHWWVGELARLVPNWLQRRLTTPAERLVIQPV